MNNLVFAIYDSKAKFYLNPFIMRSKGEALRGFMDLANDKQTAIGKHPEDYFLVHIATYDDQVGRYENVDKPETMGRAIEFVSDERKKPQAETLLPVEGEEKCD